MREEPGPSLDGGATNAVKAEDKARTHASMHRHQRYSWADIRGTHGPTSEVLMSRHQRYSWTATGAAVVYLWSEGGKMEYITASH